MRNCLTFLTVARLGFHHAVVLQCDKRHHFKHSCSYKTFSLCGVKIKRGTVSCITQKNIIKKLKYQHTSISYTRQHSETNRQSAVVLWIITCKHDKNFLDPHGLCLLYFYLG